MDLKQLLFGQPKASVSMPAQVSGSTEEWLPVADISHGIIALKDGRFIKIIEILPVNFLLKTPAEKASIIYYYASYLKIAPDNLQICVLTKRADMSAYAERMRGYQNSEPNALCRELNEDNIREVEYLAENEALQKRILLVYQLEPGMKLREESIEAIGERMLEEEEKARNYAKARGFHTIAAVALPCQLNALALWFADLYPIELYAIEQSELECLFPEVIIRDIPISPYTAGEEERYVVAE